MLSRKAYAESYYIINEMSDELKSKIPSHIIKNIQNKMDKNYKMNADNLLPDTEKILSVLYTDYIASDEERKIIKNKEKLVLKSNRKCINKYPVKEIGTESNIIETKSIAVEVKKEKWYMNVFNFFKRLVNK